MKHLADLSDAKSAAFYADVQPAEMEKFRAFCESCPYKQITRSNLEWPYLDNQRPGEALLLLSGALSIPDISWPTIAHFAGQYRVIAPAYPAVKTMTELVDGIAALLQQEGISRAHVLGGSYGGLVAQVFVRLHPGLARSLALSHTFAPDPATAAALRKMIGWLTFLPQGLLRRLMGKRMAKLLPPRSAETALLHALFAELMYHRLTKADILGIFWRTIDYAAQKYTPQDLAAWPGKVLLVMADDDPGTPQAVRAAMLALYPGASQHLFHGSGHTTAITREAEYQARLDQFFAEAA